MHVLSSLRRLLLYKAVNRLFKIISRLDVFIKKKMLPHINLCSFPKVLVAEIKNKFSNDLSYLFHPIESQMTAKLMYPTLTRPFTKI